MDQGTNVKYGTESGMELGKRDQSLVFKTSAMLGMGTVRNFQDLKKKVYDKGHDGFLYYCIHISEGEEAWLFCILLFLVANPIE